MFNLQPVSIEVDAECRICGVNMVRTTMGAPDAHERRCAEIIAAMSTFLMSMR